MHWVELTAARHVNAEASGKGCSPLQVCVAEANLADKHRTLVRLAIAVSKRSENIPR
jgi:hypothetical protein